MSPRKVQVDWKIGIKNCTCGHPNHLDDTHCVKCGFEFEGKSLRPRKHSRIRWVYRFLLLTTMAVYLTLYLSSPRLPVQQTIALAQTTEANIESIQSQLLSLTTAVDWPKVWSTIETTSEDWILILATQIQTLEKRFTNEAYVENIKNRLVSLTSTVDWHNLWSTIETSAKDRLLILATQFQTLEQQFSDWNQKISQSELFSAQREAQVQRDQKATAAATPTALPATPMPTSAPTASRPNIDLVLDVQVQLGNVRKGPGMNYEIIGKVEKGERLDDIVEESGGWYRFCCVEGDKLGWLHSSLVTTSRAGKPPSHAGNLPSHIIADPYYQKYLDAGGLPILAPASVSDEELKRAQAVTLAMVADRPDLLNVLAAHNTRILLYDKEKGGLTQLPEFADTSGASGMFGPTSYGMAVASPAMTTYHCNETLIHEIAHALDRAIQLQEWEANRPPAFERARNQAYLSAKEAGLWDGSYASTVSDEYWAEMVVHWLRPDVFRTQFGLWDLSEYDSRAARLIGHYLGNPTLPDFCQTRQFSIRGRVLDERGNPIPQVWVTLSAWETAGESFKSLRRSSDSVAERTGPDGRFWIKEVVDPGLLEKADFFTLGIWRGAPADGWTACSIAGIMDVNNSVEKYMGQERRINLTGQDLSGHTITVPTGFDWSPILDCQ